VNENVQNPHDAAVDASHSAGLDAEPQTADNSNGDSSTQELERMQNELNEARDRLLRAQAEFDNFRKRSRRELDDERKFANVPLLRDLLPVADNMDRAIEASQKTADAATLLEGFRMVRQQLETVLERYDCQPIAALGEHFDPNLHQAITTQPSQEHPSNTVLAVVQQGYQVHNRVVRPSQVIVSAR
jgi:molecular chaperone GrpE